MFGNLCEMRKKVFWLRLHVESVQGIGIKERSAREYTFFPEQKTHCVRKNYEKKQYVTHSMQIFLKVPHLISATAASDAASLSSSRRDML